MSISYKKNRAMSRILRNKFHAAPAPQPQAAPEAAASMAYPLSCEIPKSYNDTYVRAIPKDPQNTFVYWEMPKKEAENNGMEANGKAHTGNGEAAAIQNKVNGGGEKPRRGEIDNNMYNNYNYNDNNYYDNNDSNNNNNSYQDNNNYHNDNQNNNNHSQNQGQYYDFESNSWRNGELPPQQQQHNNANEWNHLLHDYESVQDNHQLYHNDSNGFDQNHQHHHEQNDYHGYDGNQGNRQTYQLGGNGHGGGQHCYQSQPQYYSLDGNNRRYYHTEYRHILAQLDRIGCVYVETSGVIAGTTVITREYSIILDICKSQVRPDIAALPYLNSGVLYKKVTVPPPHLSSGILYKNHSAAGKT